MADLGAHVSEHGKASERVAKSIAQAEDHLLAELVARIRALPRHELRAVFVTGHFPEPYVEPFAADPNKTGAFVRWDDVLAILEQVYGA